MAASRHADLGARSRRDRVLTLLTVAVKVASLHVAKALGMFRLAEMLTAHWLRILCYHGASWDDEHLFRPTLFMSPANFEQRMTWLKRRGFAVLALKDALLKRRENRLPQLPTVITIDDGWSGTGEFMLPVLRKHGFPATLYVATRALDEPGPVLPIYIDHLLWRARMATIDLATVDRRLSGQHRLRTPADRSAVAAILEQLLREVDTRTEGRALVDRLADRLASETTIRPGARMVELMTRDELAHVHEYGVDLQLHTHNHRMPIDDMDKLRSEIEANRAALALLATTSLRHFCYPGGRHHPRVLPILAELGIESATTCELGLVDSKTPDLLLPRFLDADDLDSIVFEAEMSGILELARRCRRAMWRQ